MLLKTHLPLLKNYRLPLFVLLVSLMCAAVYTAGARAWIEASSPHPAPAVAQSTAAQLRVETERVTIRPTGFEPAQITRPQGEFILAADNLSGLREVTLVLERERGERVRERRVTLQQFKWRQRLDLRPGRYVLREAGHPDWIFTLTITPR